MIAAAGRLSCRIPGPEHSDLRNTASALSFHVVTTPLQPPPDVRRTCSSCGTDIPTTFAYRHWRQCSVCYWKQRAEASGPLPALRRTQRDLRARAREVSEAIEGVQTELASRRASLPARPGFFRRLFGVRVPADIAALTSRRAILQQEESDLESKIAALERAARDASEAQKRLQSALLYRQAAERNQSISQVREEQFRTRCAALLAAGFDRAQFDIQRTDYRRGNAVDNYVRAALADIVLAAFDRACACCGDPATLTFDHYGITKNEGGNFILIASDHTSLRVNLVVLCRTCNSRKGQNHHIDFFETEALQRIADSHRRILEGVLRDSNFVSMLTNRARRR